MSKNLVSSPNRGSYVIGAALGAAVGLMATILYSRAAEEERLAGGEPQRLQVAQMITLGLALLGVLRQITEMGRPTARRRK
jgi:hypothetical protein